MLNGTQSIMELPIDVMLNTDSPDRAESVKSVFNLNGTPSPHQIQDNRVSVDQGQSVPLSTLSDNAYAVH